MEETRVNEIEKEQTSLEARREEIKDVEVKQVEIKNVEEKQSYRTAGFWVRFLAYSIDIISISAVAVTIISIVNSLTSLSLSNIGWLQVGVATVGVTGYLYFILMTRFWSQTLGKMVFGIKVIKQDGQPLDWITVIVREVAGRTISQLLGTHFGYLWIAFRQDKRGWHDMFCDTYVVYVSEVEKSRWVQASQ